MKEYAKSFRLNVGCACAIEHDIRACAIGNGLQAGCVDMTLERYGFQRVSFVLANSLCKMEHPESIREDVLAWGEQIYVPPDGDNNRYYAVDAATPLLEAFIGQCTPLHIHSGACLFRPLGPLPLREFLQLLPRPVRQVLFVQHPDEVGPVPARLLAVSQTGRVHGPPGSGGRTTKSRFPQPELIERAPTAFLQRVGT